MKHLLIFFLALSSAGTAPARQAPTAHLLQPDLGAFCTITSVEIAVSPDHKASRMVRFGFRGGVIDIQNGTVTGKAADGSDVTVPLAQVRRVGVSFEKDGRVYRYDALVDPLHGREDWLPPGRIDRVLLTSGLIIDFERVGPGLDLEKRELHWSCRDEAVTRIPFPEVALVRVKPNSFITDPSDLADYCALAGVDSISGGKLTVRGLSGRLDSAGGTVQCDDQEIGLSEVRRIAVVDCRGRIFEEPAPMVEVSRQLEKGYDFENLYLLNRRVKVRGAGGGGQWIEGTVTDQDGQGLQLFTDKGTARIDLENIEELKISKGTGGNSGTGAAIGAGIVGAAGLGLGLAMLSDGFFDTSRGDVVAITMVGAGAGALVGACIGALIRTEKWEEPPRMSLKPVLTPDRTPGLGLSYEF